MKPLLRLLISTLLLALAPLAVQAQGSSLLAKDKPIDAAENLLPTAMYLMILSYSCQEVAGIENYTQIKGVTQKLISTLGQDEKEADIMVAKIEELAKQSCPDTKTCWRDFNDLPAGATLLQGQETCLTNINNGLTVMGKQMENLMADLNSSSSSSAAP